MDPIIKWCGGKRNLLPQIDKVIGELDSSELHYLEPFLGGASVMLHVMDRYNFKSYTGSDINPHLMNMYSIIKDDHSIFDNLVMRMQNEYKSYEKFTDCKSMYLRVRSEYNNENSSGDEHAAKFYFLMKLCFNGLYRTGPRGFNSSFVGKKHQVFYDRESVLKFHKIINNCNISCRSFTDYFDTDFKDTLVYLDPPYYKTMNYSTNYTNKKLLKLVELCNKIHNDGGYFLMSNSSHQYVRDLFSLYRIIEVSGNRSMTRNLLKRGKCEELLITNIK